MRRTALLLVVLSAALCASCGGGGGGSVNPPPHPAITVSVSPATATIDTGDTVQFTATVRNTTNTQVTWQVETVTGGNETVGMISVTGLYTAPASVPTPAGITIKAISVADSSKTATATATITLPTGLQVTPESVTVPAGSSQQFIASLDGVESTDVTWAVSGTAGGNTTVGTISPQGLYTAPLSPPPTGVATITAASQANPDDSASAAATIVFSNATLNGRYAFTYASFGGNAAPLAAGTWLADGQGRIVDGLIEVFLQPQPLAGTYNIGPDGRGSVTLTTAEGTSTLRFVMSSSHEGRVMPFDTTMTSFDFMFTPDTIGIIEKQDASAFQNSALQGGYAFALSGFGLNGNVAISGRFTADGTGGISEGVEDHNDGGVVQSSLPFAGSYTVDSTGHGIATLDNPLGVSTLSFYVVSAEKLLVLSAGTGGLAIGRAQKQTLGDFSNARLSGNYVFTSFALNAGVPIYHVGRFSANGGGIISAGLLDTNESGTASENVGFTATYNIMPNGRGTMTLTRAGDISNFALAMISDQAAFFVQIDPARTEGGRLYAQQGDSFATASLAGGWSLKITGLSIKLFPQFAAGWLGLTAQANADGAGNLAGANDSNFNDGTNPGSLFVNAALSGAGSVSPNGRVSAAMNTADGNVEFRGYMVSESRILFIGTDTFHFVIGGATRQY